MQQKIEKNCFWDDWFSIGIVKLSLLRTIYFSSSANKKHSQGLECRKQKLFPTQLTWQWSMNLIKILSCRFQQCLGTFIMSLVEGSSEIGLFRYLSDYVFGVRNIGNTESMTVTFFFKIFKIHSRFKKSSKKVSKRFLFLR